jgi:glucan-binding YG repeat protein
MLTGWVQTADGKWYFFENNKNVNEGKMIIGWRNVGGSWYYFTEDGSMLVDAITPDGYKVNTEGKWIQ